MIIRMCNLQLYSSMGGVHCFVRAQLFSRNFALNYWFLRLMTMCSVNIDKYVTVPTGCIFILNSPRYLLLSRMLSIQIKKSRDLCSVCSAGDHLFPVHCPLARSSANINKQRVLNLISESFYCSL